jgi:predicted kinase
MTKSQRKRVLSGRLPTADKRRLVVITGARQTGKTTLARKSFPDLPYHNLDAVEARVVGVNYLFPSTTTTFTQLTQTSQAGNKLPSRL